jgi:tRNA-specific 2-thiouridylase
MSHREKVAIAMSGGVDSSMAAALLVERGYDVRGVSLRMWEGNRGPRVCSDHRGAKEIAAALGIPHTLLDLRRRFADDVVKPFAQDYLRGRTPNPCVACNRDFKFGALLHWAEEQKVDFIATGHYARLSRHENGRAALLRATDRAKDQSYFLFALSQQQLARVLFPLGDMHKSEVRARAVRLGLPSAERPESQDICFGDYKELVARYAANDTLAGGDVVDLAGNIVGRHSGIHAVTIGQRRGLGVAAAEPLYVVAIDDASRRITVGSKADLRCMGLVARSVNWLDEPDNSEIEAEVQIRYRAAAIPCVIRHTPTRSCEVLFNEPLAAVTPGQAAVFYRGDKLLGGGWIERAIRGQVGT